MSPVMTDNEILEQLSRSLEADNAKPQTPVRQLPQGGLARFIAALKRLMTLPWNGRTTEIQQRILHPHKPFEMPADTLAKKHPFLYIKSTCG